LKFRHSRTDYRYCCEANPNLKFIEDAMRFGADEALKRKSSNPNDANKHLTMCNSN
jgi:hypothetical protein